uniref:Uncharacterized protein n=1 Tax=Tanacetum cinerariifolium TaxID=118510 RepID=A0A6L2J5W3_TANCI|nr:hypothetical protein [Tanacetum cinerariifolium]
MNLEQHQASPGHSPNEAAMCVSCATSVSNSAASSKPFISLALYPAIIQAFDSLGRFLLSSEVPWDCQMGKGGGGGNKPRGCELGVSGSCRLWGKQSMHCYLFSLPRSLMNSVRMVLGEMVTNFLPSTPSWKSLEYKSLDPLAPQPLQFMLKTGLLISRKCLRCWDMLTSLKLGWLAINLRVMLLVGAKGGEVYVVTLSWKDFREILFLQYFPMSEQQKYEREYHTICQREDELTDGIVNTEFTSVAHVANTGINIEILRERGGSNNKRNRDGDRIQPAARNNNQKGYDQRRSDGHGYDRHNNN